MIPFTLLLSAFFAENNHAVVVFEAFQKNFDRVADLYGVNVFEFIAVHNPFGFVADINEDFIVLNAKYFARHNRAEGEVLEGIAVHCIDSCGVEAD